MIVPDPGSFILMIYIKTMKKINFSCLLFLLGFSVLYGCNSANSSPDNSATDLKVHLTPSEVCIGKTDQANADDSVVTNIVWDGLSGYTYSLALSNIKNTSLESLPGEIKALKDEQESVSLSNRQIWAGLSQMDLKKDTMALLNVTVKGIKEESSIQASKSLEVHYKNTYSLAPLSGDSVRIASYNLLFEKTVPSVDAQKWAARRIQVERLFKACHLDVVGTQEALTRQVNDLLTALPDYARLGTDLWGSFSATNENEALFYNKKRLDVLDSGEFWYSTTPDKAGSYSWEATYPRMCIWGKFEEKSTGKIFYVFNSHFHVDFPQSRLESAKLLLTYVIKRASEGYPVVCTGDFNSDDSSEALQVLLKSGFLVDSKNLATSHSGCDGTYHGFDLTKVPTATIDHIFVTKDIGVGPYHVVDEELQTGKFGSDHLPVITDIKLP